MRPVRELLKLAGELFAELLRHQRNSPTPTGTGPGCAAGAGEAIERAARILPDATATREPASCGAQFATLEELDEHFWAVSCQRTTSDWTASPTPRSSESNRVSATVQKHALRGQEAISAATTMTAVLYQVPCATRRCLPDGGEDRHLPAVAAVGWKLGASLSRGSPGEGGSTPDKDASAWYLQRPGAASEAGRQREEPAQ